MRRLRRRLDSSGPALDLAVFRVLSVPQLGLLRAGPWIFSKKLNASNPLAGSLSRSARVEFFVQKKNIFDKNTSSRLSGPQASLASAAAAISSQIAAGMLYSSSRDCLRTFS